jgi:hypothetical protein
MWVGQNISLMFTYSELPEDDFKYPALIKLGHFVELNEIIKYPTDWVIMT